MLRPQFKFGVCGIVTCALLIAAFDTAEAGHRRRCKRHYRATYDYSQCNSPCATTGWSAPTHHSFGCCTTGYSYGSMNNYAYQGYWRQNPCCGADWSTNGGHESTEHSAARPIYSDEEYAPTPPAPAPTPHEDATPMEPESKAEPSVNESNATERSDARPPALEDDAKKNLPAEEAPTRDAGADKARDLKESSTDRDSD